MHNNIAIIQDIFIRENKTLYYVVKCVILCDHINIYKHFLFNKKISGHCFSSMSIGGEVVQDRITLIVMLKPNSMEWIIVHCFFVCKSIACVVA